LEKIMSQFSAATAFDRTLTNLYGDLQTAMTAVASAARQEVRAKRLADELALVRELSALVARAERERRQWPPEVESLSLIRRAEALAYELAKFWVPPPGPRGPRRGRPGGGRKRRAVIVTEAREITEARFERLAVEARDVLRELQVVRHWEAGAEPADAEPAAPPPPPPDDVEWSRVESPEYIAGQLNMSARTLNRVLEDGGIRHKRFSTKLLMVALADVPADARERLRSLRRDER
jgi:hypothetical protein